MNNEIVKFIKSISINEKVQKLLIETIGKILLEQNDLSLILNENRQKIIHIRDWISSVIENNEEWKKPRVLTIDALNNSANKYFEKQNNKLKTIELDETHEKLIADLGDYYIIQMLTPESLDNESKQMQHCIGLGGYDNNLKKEEYKYLSLRDKYNKAHVTLETNNNKIYQLQGKQNELPNEKYLEILLPWLIENKFDYIPWLSIGKYYENGQWFDFDKIEIKEGIDYNVVKISRDVEHLVGFSYKFKLYYKLNNKKENIDFDLDEMFDEMERSIVELIKDDKNSIVNYNIIYYKKKIYFMFFDTDKNIIEENFEYIDKNKIFLNKKLINYLIENKYCNVNYCEFGYIKNEIDKKLYPIGNSLPENLVINHNVKISKNDQLTKLPNNLTINGKLEIDLCHNFSKLSENLIVNDSFSLWNCKNFKKLPNNLIINGNCTLYFLPLKEIPNDLVFNGDIFSIGHLDIKNIPNKLDFSKCEVLIASCKKIKELPDDFSAKKLTMNSCQNFKEFKDNVRIKESLYLPSAYVERLPENLNLTGTLRISGCQKLKKMPEKLSAKHIEISPFQKNIIHKDIDFDSLSILGIFHYFNKEEFFKLKEIPPLFAPKLYRNQ